MRKFLLLPCVMLSSSLFSQNVGIGTTTPNASAQLEVSSTVKGILIPRMTQAQRTAIANPAQALLVYQTDGTVGFYLNRSSIPAVPNWSIITEGTNQWNAGLAPNSIYNINSGNVGIGTNTPNMKVHINSLSDTALLQLDNNSTLANGKNVGAYFKNGSWYTGAIKTIGTGTNVARMGFYTFAATDQNDLLERMTILDNGNVGIGTNNPSTNLEVAGTVKITGGSPGNGKVLTSDVSGNASWQSPDESSGYQHLVEISVAGTTNWVVPVGVTSVLVEAWGDGGDGTTSTANLLLGGGGGGGGYCKSIIQVTPGSTLTVLRVSGEGSSGGKTRVTYNADYMEAYNGDNGNTGGGGRGGNVIRGGTGFSVNWYAAKGNSGDDNYQHSIETETGSKQIFYHGGRGGDCYNGKGGKGDVWRVVSGQPIANGFDMGAVGFPSGWGAGGAATTGYTTGNVSSLGESGGVLIYY